MRISNPERPAKEVPPCLVTEDLATIPRLLGTGRTPNVSGIPCAMQFFAPRLPWAAFCPASASELIDLNSIRSGAS